MPLTFEDAAKRFQFAPGITPAAAIQLVSAYRGLVDNEDDTRSTYIVRLCRTGDSCDYCGSVSGNWIVIDHRHPPRGGMMCQRCWLGDNGR